MKICPKCGREFGNSSVRCPICKCELLKKDEVPLKRGYGLQQSQAGNRNNERKMTEERPKQEKADLPKSGHDKGGNQKKKWVPIALCIGCLGVGYGIGSGSEKDGAPHRINGIDSVQESVVDEIEGSEQHLSGDENMDKETLLRTAIEDAVGEERLLEFLYVPEFDNTRIFFRTGDGLTAKSTVKGAYWHISEILKSIQPIIDTDVNICVKYTLFDQYGNPREDNVIIADYTLDTIQKINFDYFLWENIPELAESWWNHPAFVIDE